MPSEQSHKSVHEHRQEAMQRGILETYSRGFISESQAIRQLRLSGDEELSQLLQKFRIQPWMPSYGHAPEEMQREGSVADGFAHYWMSQNSHEEA